MSKETRDELFEQIKGLIGQDKYLAYLVEDYCRERQLPTLEDQQKAVRDCYDEGLADMLTEYVNDAKDDYRGNIRFVLGGLEVDFDYSAGMQTITMGEDTIDLISTPFIKEPSLFRNYMNHEQLVRIEAICRDTFPAHEASTVADVILHLIGNRDPCAH